MHFLSFCLLFQMFVSNTGMYWNWTETGEKFGGTVPVLFNLKIPMFLKNLSFCDSLCQAEQRRCLVEFYYNTNGPKWLKRKNWDTERFYCNWEGILCYGKTLHVIAIKLEGNNGMKGYGNSLGNLSYLIGVNMGGSELIADVKDLLHSFGAFFLRFDFAYNNIYGSLPNRMSMNWPHLAKIQLSGNGALKGALPEDLHLLKDLQVLSLGETKITGSIPPNIGLLSQLYFLDLETLDLTGNLKYLQGLSKLWAIHLMSNKLDRTIPDDFGNWFPNLAELSLQGNEITGSVPASIGNLHSLQLLQMSGNVGLTGKIPLSFGNLTNLEIFDISQTQILGFEKGLILHSTKLNSFVAKGNSNFFVDIYTLVDVLGESKNSLIQLDVQDCNIYGKFDKINDDTNMVNGIFHFTKLAFLNLGGNRGLYGTIPDPISSLSLVMYLNVSNTNLSSALPVSYLIKLNVLKEIDITGNSHMQGTIETSYMTIDDNSLSTEHSGDNFACPAVRLKHNNCLVKADSSYYDRRYCQCKAGHFGQGGYCRKCMNGGICSGVAVEMKNASQFLNKSYVNTNMRIKQGYWPFSLRRNVTKLIKCAWTQPGEELCNPSGSVICELRHLRGSKEAPITTCREDKSICSNGSHGRLCSQCQNNYFKNGLNCYPCPKKHDTTKQIIIIIVCVAVIILIAAFLAIFVRNRKILAVVLAILESVTVFILATMGIVPSWLAQLNVLFYVLAIGGFCKFGKGLLKTVVFYVQVMDALISSAHVWPKSIYKFEELLSSVLNLRFSIVSCNLPKLFTPAGKLILLMTVPIIVPALMLLVIFTFHLLIGRKQPKKTKKIARTCTNLSFKLINLAYFPLVKTVSSALVPCRYIDEISFMPNYVWIDCSSKDYHLMQSLSLVAVVFYVVGIPLGFLAVLFWQRRNIAQENENTQQWLGSLYMPYKTDYRVLMEFMLMLRRTCLAFLIAYLSTNIPLQTTLIASVFIIYLAFESHAKPFIVRQPANRDAQANVFSEFGLENLVELAMLVVLLLSFIAVQSSLQGEHVNEQLIWTIITLNALLSLTMICSVIFRLFSRGPVDHTVPVIEVNDNHEQGNVEQRSEHGNEDEVIEDHVEANYQEIEEQDDFHDHLLEEEHQR